MYKNLTIISTLTVFLLHLVFLPFYFEEPKNIDKIQNTIHSHNAHFCKDDITKINYVIKVVRNIIHYFNCNEHETIVTDDFHTAIWNPPKYF